MAHHCIGNPCWICNPLCAPRQEEKNFNFWQKTISEYKFGENKISILLQNMLIEIFQCGLNEDAHFRCNKDITLENIKLERLNIPNDTLEAKLLDLMIDDFDFENKSDID